MTDAIAPADIPEPDGNNVWRLSTPGAKGWKGSAQPDATNKYFMVSADGHAQEPLDFLSARIDKKFHHRLPGVVLLPGGSQAQKTEGFREPLKLRKISFDGEDRLRNKTGRTLQSRLADHKADGIDAEVIFPNKGLTIWATRDIDFSTAMCRAFNDWAWDEFGDHNETLAPMACIAPGDVESAIAEVERSADRGFKGLSLPCKPAWGPADHNDLNYNLKEFDPLWATIVDANLPITFHVSTGRDPRTSRSRGGAVINYAVHSLAPTMEPIANLCASGVCDQFPTLRFGSVEAGIGWVGWALQAMDEAYRKHHMFVRPKLELLPSEYFQRQGFATFQDDQVGLDLAQKHGLVNNFLWANDYPHHEGSWPHSAQTIERTMGHLSDQERAKILGLNAAEIFGFDVPEHQQITAFQGSNETAQNPTPR